MISWTIYITFGSALLLLLMPRFCARWIALGAAGAGCVVSFLAFFQASDPGTFTTITRAPWVPSLGIEYHLAADGISLTLALVTGLTAVSAVLFSWNVNRRQNEFFFWLLLVIGGSYGVFLSADLFLFLVFYELVIIPKYFLIAIWGSSNRIYGATKLTLYSFFGGALVLLGIAAIYVTGNSFDLSVLSPWMFPGHVQAWLFPVLFIGFGLLAGIWPLHTWAPTGHVAAPTAGSMLLAGVIMKLGAYGALRVAMALLPTGFEMWRGVFSIFAVAGIVYASAAALRQRDLKFVIGYSSVSHMGFVLVGLLTARRLGVAGAVLQMFSHGIIAGLLFAVVGRMVYERTHTRDLRLLSTMGLSRALPLAAFAFAVASAASMGIPGFSGFIAEITILAGLWQDSPVLVLIAGAGMILTAAFTLRALRLTFFSGIAPTEPFQCEPISFAEKCGAGLLMAATLAAGLWPQPLFDRIMPCLNAMPWLKP